jgi:hypothetical protein
MGTRTRHLRIFSSLEERRGRSPACSPPLLSGSVACDCDDRDDDDADDRLDHVVLSMLCAQASLYPRSQASASSSTASPSL